MKNNDDEIFNLKEHFTYDSSYSLYVVIFPTSGDEYTDETAIDKMKLRDHNGVYWQSAKLWNWHAQEFRKKINEKI